MPLNPRPARKREKRTRPINIQKKAERDALINTLRRAEELGQGAIMQHGSGKYHPKTVRGVLALLGAPAGSLFILYGLRPAETLERGIGPGLKVMRSAGGGLTGFFCIKQKNERGTSYFMPLFLHGPLQKPGCWDRYSAGIYSLGDLLKLLKLGKPRFYGAKVNAGGGWLYKLPELAE
ncbi:MAG: hypothetical protein V1676_04950 [Candidatus Diapherotrites archaeon]